MTSLVVSLGTGKGTWAHVAKLVSQGKWETVYLITSEFFSGKFPVRQNHELIIIDTNRPLKMLVEDITKSLYGKIAGTEVALNLVSGTGKEHMAILASVLKLGLGIRFVAFTGKEIEEI